VARKRLSADPASGEAFEPIRQRPKGRRGRRGGRLQRRREQRAAKAAQRAELRRLSEGTGFDVPGAA
jgi:hypothetical protein